MSDLDSIRQRLRETIEKEVKRDEYHKRSILLGLSAELREMMDMNISIPRMVDALDKAGLKVSAQSLRTFFESQFGSDYREYLFRNGWHRKPHHPSKNPSPAPNSQPASPGLVGWGSSGSSSEAQGAGKRNPLLDLSSGPRDGEFNPGKRPNIEIVKGD